MRLAIYNPENCDSALEAEKEGALYEVPSDMDVLETCCTVGDVMEILDTAAECIGGCKLKGAVKISGQWKELKDYLESI